MSILTLWAILIIALIAFRALISALKLKYQMTYDACIKCMEADMELYLAGPSYNQMLYNPFRWTFAQHYPELAKRVKP